MRAVRQIGAIAVLIATATSPALALELRCERMAMSLDSKTGDVFLDVQIDAESAVRLGRLTKNNVGSFLRIAIDGREIARPVIREPVLDGSMRISVPPGEIDAMRKVVREHGEGPKAITASIKTNYDSP